jgi:hypothetical protein
MRPPVPGGDVVETIFRAGEREWLSEGLIPAKRTDRKGIGVSMTAHIGIAAFVGFSVMRQVASLPMLERPVAVLVTPVVMAPVQLTADPVVRRPTPLTPTAAPTPRPAPRLASAPARPLEPPASQFQGPSAPAEAPAAPVEAPPQVLPEALRAESGLVGQNIGAINRLPEQSTGPPGGISEEPVDDVDVNPRFVKQVQPKLPVGATGNVDVEVLVQTTGRVSRVRFRTETPYRAQIEEAAMQCVFAPARRRGRPVAHWTLVQFQLETNTGTRR